MSESAFNEFESARSEQLQKNEARRMRTLVNQARGDPHRSANRWPFELTQNAHDPGVRPGLAAVNIHLSFDGQTVVYEHDGKPFSMRDLAALLSGGSSKDFESMATTGRFGTGFLMTHVLSLQIGFQGVLQTKAGYEQVILRLDRYGDEEEIYANTISCNAAIEDASPLVGLDGQSTACFKYGTDGQEAARIGLEAFSKTLPYLYGTCEHLGNVTVRSENDQALYFTPDKPLEREFESVQIRERLVTTVANGGKPRALRAIRIRKKSDSPSSLIIVIEQFGERWHVSDLDESFPRLFCRFPIRLSEFLPINAVIDGRFDLPQERDCILMKDQNRDQIADSLELLPILVRLALKEDWNGAHKLARIGMPQRFFGEALEESDKNWWSEMLRATARKLAGMPIVNTIGGEFHRVGEPSPNAKFILPRFDVKQPMDELDFKATWESASELQDTRLPLLEIAAEWTAIVSEWVGLGINVDRLGLSEMASLAREGATHISQLQVKSAPLGWLARFLNLVGEIAGQHNCTKILANLLPDQNGNLKSPVELHSDAGVDDDIKDISARVRLDVRSRLLSLELLANAVELGLSQVKDLLNSQIPRSLANSAVTEECRQELLKQLPDAKPVTVEKQSFREASIDLLQFLWNTQGANAASVAQKCPLIASDNSAVRWTTQRKAMAPVSCWHQEAQAFAKLYKSDRVLSEDYVTRFGGERKLVDALIAWDMAFADPICTDTPRELRDERLKMMAESADDCEGVIVVDETLAQIALLPTELIQRCQNDKELAKLLLGLVLKHLAPHDSSWQMTKAVPGRRAQERVSVSIRPALWLSDLRTKAWVPVEGEHGFEHVIANAGNLRELFDPGWLAGNNSGIQLLTQYFAFNELVLRLDATAPSPELRKEVENGLSMIVQTLGSDAKQYHVLAADLNRKKQQEADRERNRRFGLGVQRAIEKYLKLRNLNLVLVDRGYDYDVFLDETAGVEAGTQYFQLADYFLEVKATTTGDVRLSSLQAQTACAQTDHFILCVVDLRGITNERMEADWTEEDVEPRTKIIEGVGQLVDQPHSLVVAAKKCEVGIRNETALRYGVPVSIWEGGTSISDWINQLGD